MKIAKTHTSAYRINNYVPDRYETRKLLINHEYLIVLLIYRANVAVRCSVRINFVRFSSSGIKITAARSRPAVFPVAGIRAVTRAVLGAGYTSATVTRVRESRILETRASARLLRFGRFDKTWHAAINRRPFFRTFPELEYRSNSFIWHISYTNRKYVPDSNRERSITTKHATPVPRTARK